MTHVRQNQTPRYPRHLERAALVALVAISLCACRSGVSSSVGASKQTPQPAVNTPPMIGAAHPSPAPPNAVAHAQPQVGCPCCSGEADYAKFSVAYDQKNPPTAPQTPTVQQVGYAEPCGNPGMPGHAGGLPLNAWTGGPHDGYTHPTAHISQYPYGVPAGVSAWAPAGVQRPWPHDEFIFDGGDKQPHVEVAPDWTVHGLQLEDTVAHFDTLDGRTLVEPANRVPLYAPRFAAVRKVYGIEAHHHRTPALVHDQPSQVVIEQDAQLAVDADQYLHMRTNLGIKSPITNLEERGPVTLMVQLTPETFLENFAPYEDLQIIRAGIYDNSEKARLSQMAAAATVWTIKQAPQVILDETQPLTAVVETKAQETVKYELAGKPRLRIVKVANRTEARPGDIVEFTLRFDNIGTQTIGNVTIIDSLTTRLEYASDTAQCSRRANFITEENIGDSLVLRWEIIEPMKPGEGGVIRFRCRVR
jgi:uncharacterized repeat protein (TIGR01451 family)